MNSTRKHCLPPDIKIFLKEKYWALHEAAFVLTEWPKNQFFKANIRL